MPSELLRTLTTATSGVVGTAFLRALVRHLADAYDADSAYLAEADDDGFTVVAAWGSGPPEGWRTSPAEATGFVVPLGGSGGETIGLIAVEAADPIDPPDDEREAIRLFAARAAAELERRHAEQELRAREAEVAASGARMVERADAERRRLGRELHDGAQQRLVVLGQRLDLARRAVHEDPEKACTMLDAARSEMRAIGEELRDMARGLAPAGLQQHGLAGALQVLASRSPLPVEVGGLPDRRLPDAIEATLYFLVSEAIGNAIKHAEASRMKVDIGFRGGALVGEIADDGRGGAQLDPEGGLQGLADRVAAVGGTLEVTSPNGKGTRLTVTIPMNRWRTEREPFLEFGFQGDQGDGERSIRQILTGEKTASVSLEREWALEGGVPRIGQRLPVRDYTGRQWCCVEVERVALLPFGGVGTDIVAAEASGAASVEEWRAGHRTFYDGSRHELAVLLGEPGWRLTDEEPMVIIWFHVVDGTETASAGAEPVVDERL
jgi:signal transduction histidine kinase